MSLAAFNDGAAGADVSPGVPSDMPREDPRVRPVIRRDLLDCEQRLRDSLRRVIPFESHALYFPRGTGPDAPEWLPEEEKLLIPLRRDGELLGIFMARRPDPALVPALLPALPGVVALCLDNIALYKNARTDALTGLATGEALRERLLREAGFIRASFTRSDDDGEDDHPHVGSMGLVAVRFSGLRDIVRQFGYAFAERLLAALAEAFAASLPEGALAARPGDYTLAAFLPETPRPRCEDLGNAILQAMNQVRLIDPLSGRRIGVRVHAGYALYPQDMDGERLRDMTEHAHVLLHKAELAADVAKTRSRRREAAGDDSPRPARVMAYSRLLQEGGDIRALLPLSRVLVSLGYRVGGREGQHFSVWAENSALREGIAGEPAPLYKGEIVLLEVRESESVAEILSLGDPAWPLEPGDALTLLPDERGTGETTEHGEKAEDAPRAPARVRSDPLTGLLGHGDFLARLAEARSGCRRFGIALAHVSMYAGPPPTPGMKEAQTLEARPGHAFPPPSPSQPPLPADHPDRLMAGLTHLCREVFDAGRNEAGFGAAVVGGRFGLNSLVFFHPEVEEAAFRARYAYLCAEATRRLGRRVGAGLAVWPFLRFRPADMLECARKALEYALLLPEPHVGLFDSLALNISADKRHCRGDIFGAVEEYKLALLADDGNALAWNSLGVCMASLGRRSDARHFFEEALRRAPDDPDPAYNLGAVCQSMGDLEEATARFYACLTLSPSHLYAKVRLGQIAESAGRLDEAARLFREAAAMDDQSALPHRHLAGLALRRHSTDTAREHLHQALLRNPRDAAALTLMAKLYLDGGEDPELATSLARQAVAHRPDRKQGWLVLARALDTLGHAAEAREARLKAGEI